MFRSKVFFASSRDWACLPRSVRWWSCMGRILHKQDDNICGHAQHCRYPTAVSEFIPFRVTAV